MKSKPLPAWAFFAATFLWSWSFWGVAIAFGATMETGAGMVLLLIGVLGPMVMGISFTQLSNDRALQRDYWMRLVSLRRIRWGWLAVILSFSLILNGVAALIEQLSGGFESTWGAVIVDGASDPLSILPLFLFAILVPLIEEMGWRGYVLDRLQTRYSALTSSLVLGVVWSLWHLPLFFVAGSYQAGLGIGTPEFWLFFLSIIPLTVIITWIYNNTGRSIFAAILFHGMVNFSGEIIALSPRADTIAAILWLLAAICVIVGWGGRCLVRQPAR